MPDPKKKPIITSAKKINNSKSKVDVNKKITFRDVNDNLGVQTAKLFDPTGISSYPDVYYAIDDYQKGKGSGWNVALNVLGALPVLGKLGKAAGMLSKSEKLAKTANKIGKIEKIIDNES